METDTHDGDSRPESRSMHSFQSQNSLSQIQDIEMRLTPQDCELRIYQLDQGRGLKAKPAIASERGTPFGLIENFGPWALDFYHLHVRVRIESPQPMPRGAPVARGAASENSISG